MTEGDPHIFELRVMREKTRQGGDAPGGSLRCTRRSAAAGLISLVVTKQYEPTLLPIGFGCLLANIPFTGTTDDSGLFAGLCRAGIGTGVLPLLISIGVGVNGKIGISTKMSRSTTATVVSAGQQPNGLQCSAIVRVY